LILNSKLIFLDPKLVFQFRKLLIGHKNEHFTFEYFYMNMKNYIYSQNISFKFSIIIWFEPEIQIPNYYFGFSKLILQIWKLVIESKNVHFNFEYCYLNMKIDNSILKIFI